MPVDLPATTRRPRATKEHPLSSYTTRLQQSCTLEKDAKSAERHECLEAICKYNQRTLPKFVSDALYCIYNDVDNDDRVVQLLTNLLERLPQSERTFLALALHHIASDRSADNDATNESQTVRAA